MRRPSLPFVVALAAFAAGCVAPNGVSRAGVMVDPTPAARSELTEVVSAALGGVPITLADDALTASSVLVIERSLPRGLDVPPVGGRNMETPVTFRLIAAGSRCVLENQGNGRRWTLRESRCRAL